MNSVPSFTTYCSINLAKSLISSGLVWIPRSLGFVVYLEVALGSLWREDEHLPGWKVKTIALCGAGTVGSRACLES